MPKGFQSMPNMNNMLKQAQKMQKQMEDVQAEMEQKTLEVTSGGGAVKIVISGKKEIKSIELTPEIIDPDDVEMLQDLLLAALNEAVRQAEEMMASAMSKVTGGMGGMGGLF